MKKILSLILAMLMLSAAFTSCSDKENNETTPDTQNTETTDPGESSSNGGELTTREPLEVLENVWAQYGDDEKFPAAGGDYSEENNKMDAPGVYSTSDAETLDNTLGLMASDVEKINSAASLMHMMNANTFTGAAYSVKNTDDMSTIVTNIKENLLNRQWMCGFPDTLVIYTIDNCIVTAFGNAELIETFKSKVTAAYENAKLEVEESLL